MISSRSLILWSHCRPLFVHPTFVTVTHLHNLFPVQTSLAPVAVRRIFILIYPILEMAAFRALSGILPSLVQGIAFTSPVSSDVITKGGDFTAKWTSVDTDPTVFSLYAWNFVQWPPYYEALAYGVDTAAGEATVRIPCHVANGEGWQLTALNDTNVYVLYAQSDKFNVTGDACADPTASASCYAPASTVYVTQTAGETPNCTYCNLTPRVRVVLICISLASTVATATAASPTSSVASVIKPGVASAASTYKPEVVAANIDLSLDLDIAI